MMELRHKASYFHYINALTHRHDVISHSINHQMSLLLHKCVKLPLKKRVSAYELPELRYPLPVENKSSFFVLKRWQTHHCGASSVLHRLYWGSASISGAQDVTARSRWFHPPVCCLLAKRWHCTSSCISSPWTHHRVKCSDNRQQNTSHEWSRVSCDLNSWTSW